MPIIKSLMDTDLYILTMMQAIFHRYTNVDARFEFKWRNWDKMHLNCKLEYFVDGLKDQLDSFVSLRYTRQELEYLSTIPFMKKDFIEYLRLFQPNRSYIHPYIKDGGIAIEIDGPLVNCAIFEVPILAMVSQLYTENSGEISFNWLQKGRKKLDEKLDYLDSHVHKGGMSFTFADFGTRRRAHVDWHRHLLMHILDRCPHYLSGTSNLLHAMDLKIKYIGTMAHFWFQIHQQLSYRLIDSQQAALQNWADEYRGELGIALSDTLGFDTFLCDFDRYFALLFDGCRQDSGDPYSWAEKLITHYKKMRIDPRSKTAVFSDGLTFETAADLYIRFHDQIRCGFGIGTYLTNDCGFLPPQIVIKNTLTNGRPTAKISDTPGKGMCIDADFESYLRKVIKEKINGHS